LTNFPRLASALYKHCPVYSVAFSYAEQKRRYYRQKYVEYWLLDETRTRTVSFNRCIELYSASRVISLNEFVKQCLLW